MIVALEHRAFETAITDVHDAAQTLSDARRRIDREVEALLATWRGVAADSFADGWADWQGAAQDVLDGLVAMRHLLDAAHADLTRSDLTSQAHLDELTGRIAARLG